MVETKETPVAEAAPNAADSPTAPGSGEAPSAVAEATTTSGTSTTPTGEEAAAGTEAAVENGAEAAAATNGNGEHAATEAAADEEKPEPPKEMRAIVLTGFGGLKGVKVLKKPEPAVQPGEVLIRVRACGLNFQDLIIRLGAIASPPKTPCILGFECAGEVEAVGEDVTAFAVGDRVVALPEFKAWAELCAVSEKYVFKLPAEMSFAEAAAITLAYVVAHVLVFEVASIKPGNSVLLHSAGGGVGQAVAQLCRTIDGVRLFGVASKGKHEALQEGGLIDHLIERGTDYLNEVRKVSPEGIDIVLDCLCGEECNRGYGLLKPMGKYVLYGSANVVTGETKSFFSVARSWWQVDKVSPIKLFDENKSLMGFNLRHLLYQQDGGAFVRKQVEAVFGLWREGKVKATVDSSWAYEDIAEAMQKMHDRKNVGKIVLDPAQAARPKPATPAKAGRASKEKKQATAAADEKKAESPNEEDKKETNGDAEPATNGDAAEPAAAAVEETKAATNGAAEPEKETAAAS